MFQFRVPGKGSFEFLRIQDTFRFVVDGCSALQCNARDCRPVGDRESPSPCDIVMNGNLPPGMNQHGNLWPFQLCSIIIICKDQSSIRIVQFMRLVCTFNCTICIAYNRTWTPECLVPSVRLNALVRWVVQCSNYDTVQLYAASSKGETTTGTMYIIQKTLRQWQCPVICIFLLRQRCRRISRRSMLRCTVSSI